MRLRSAFIQMCMVVGLLMPWCAAAAETDSPAQELWLPEPAWAQPMHDVPLTRSAQPLVQPEPIPLPPAAVAVVGPMLLTAIMARLSIKKRRPRARVMR